MKVKITLDELEILTAIGNYAKMWLRDHSVGPIKLHLNNEAVRGFTLTTVSAEVEMSPMEDDR